MSRASVSGTNGRYSTEMPGDAATSAEMPGDAATSAEVSVLSLAEGVVVCCSWASTFSSTSDFPPVLWSSFPVCLPVLGGGEER